MLRKLVLAAVSTAALAVGTLFVAAPAEAQYWHHRPYWHHGPYYRPYYRPPSDCYWTTRRVRVWTDYGPRWVRQQVRICN